MLPILYGIRFCVPVIQTADGNISGHCKELALRGYRAVSFRSCHHKIRDNRSRIRGNRRSDGVAYCIPRLSVTVIASGPVVTAGPVHVLVVAESVTVVTVVLTVYFHDTMPAPSFVATSPVNSGVVFPLTQLENPAGKVPGVRSMLFTVNEGA